jgi:hypothetical protein
MTGEIAPPTPPASEHAPALGDGPEDFVLDDGTRLRMRPLRSSDRDRIAEGLTRLSPQSRYLRFFTAKARLTDAELRYLSEVDGYDHYAIGICFLAADGTEGDGVAVGRFVRLLDEPTVAAQRGVTCFRTEFLAVNDSMRDLVAGLSPDARFVADGPVVVAEFPVTASPAAEGEASPLYEWFRLVAERAVEFRRAFAMMFDPAAIRAALERARRELAERVRGPADE